MRIAVPNKGRMSEACINLLSEAGIKVDCGRGLLSRYKDIEVLFVRTDDIPEYVQDGAADLGITGMDLVRERNARVNVLMKLGFGRARLMVAVPKKSGIKSVKDVRKGMRVATEFPNLTKKYFSKLKKRVEVVTVSGATEVTPYLGVSDLIVDLVSSGSTLELNNLRPIAEVMETEAVLIGNKDFRDADNMILSLGSVLEAKDKRYVMVNVPASKIREVKRIMPGLESPTILNLAEEDYVAVHSVISDQDVFKTIKKLKRIGGKDILVLPIERLVR